MEINVKKVFLASYDKFENCPNGKLVDTCHRTFFGLDRVSLAISYRFHMSKYIK